MAGEEEDERMATMRLISVGACLIFFFFFFFVLSCVDVCEWRLQILAEKNQLKGLVEKARQLNH